MTSVRSISGADPETPGHVRGHRRLSLALRVVGVLLLGVVVVAAAWSAEATLPTLVFGDYVLRRWHALVVLLVLAGGALLVAALVRPKPSAVRRSARSRRRALGGTVCVVLIAIAATASTALVAFVDGISEYHVLNPDSGSGCRVLVEERSALLLGSGIIYLLPADAHKARPVSSYQADDGYRPVTSGTYSLRWEGETALLEIRGTRDQPVEYDQKPLLC